MARYNAKTSIISDGRETGPYHVRTLRRVCVMWLSHLSGWHR